MKKEKIEELFNKHHTTCYDAMEARHVKVMLIGDLARAINQAELEWCKELEKKLQGIVSCNHDITIIKLTKQYYREIKNKIKELENEN